VRTIEIWAEQRINLSRKQKQQPKNNKTRILTLYLLTSLEKRYAYLKMLTIITANFQRQHA